MLEDRDRANHEPFEPFPHAGVRLRKRPSVRVGLLANTFESSFGGKAGGHIHFLEVAKRWCGVEVTVFAPELARAAIESYLPDATFVPLPSGDGIGNFQIRNLWRTVASLRRLRELRRCDVVLATSHFLPDVVPAVFCGRPVAVCIPHVLEAPNKRQGNFATNLISSIFQELAFVLVRWRGAAVFVNSRGIAERVGIRQSRMPIHLMTHGVEHLPALEAPPPRRHGAALYLGRLVPTKGIDDLLGAWPLVERGVPDAELTIVGKGSEKYEQYLRRRARDAGLRSAIVFTGSVTEEEKVAWFERSSVFVFPSKEEGWGIVIAEAMAFGLPCVVYDLPAYRNVFTQGVLKAPIGDVDRFAQLAIAALGDSELHARLSAEARELARTFSWDAAADIEYRGLLEIAR